MKEANRGWHLLTSSYRMMAHCIPGQATLGQHSQAGPGVRKDGVRKDEASRCFLKESCRVGREENNIRRQRIDEWEVTGSAEKKT